MELIVLDEDTSSSDIYISGTSELVVVNGIANFDNLFVYGYGNKSYELSYIEILPNLDQLTTGS